MDESVRAAARLALRRREIEALAARDTDFRSLCDDLAEADAALGRWERSAVAQREQRCAEYREIIDDLVREIEATLDLAAVTDLDAARARRGDRDD